jgi:uncharacterized protein YndB with AHSA1/START domain
VSEHAGALVIERVLAASPAEVFDAWTAPARMADWMSPFGHAEATVDLRVGGAFLVVMVGADERIEHTGEYLELDPPRRLVFTWTSPHTGPEPSLVTVELHPHDVGTRLTLSHERLPSEVVESHRGGWGSMLERLAGAVATDRPTR